METILRFPRTFLLGRSALLELASHAGDIQPIPIEVAAHTIVVAGFILGHSHCYRMNQCCSRQEQAASKPARFGFLKRIEGAYADPCLWQDVDLSRLVSADNMRKLMHEVTCKAWRRVSGVEDDHIDRPDSDGYSRPLVSFA